MRKLLSLLCLFSILFYSPLGFAGQYYYRIKKGDTLGTILYSMGFYPLWGKSGSVASVAQSNPETIKKMGDEIEVNDVIVVTIDRIPFEHNIVKFDSGEIALKYYLKTRADMANYLVAHQDKVQASDELVAGLKADTGRVPASVAKIEHLKPFGELGFRPYTGFKGLDFEDATNGASGELFSSSLYGVILDWSQVWNEKVTTRVFADIQKVEWEKPSNRNITDDSQTPINVGVGVKYQVSKKFSWSADVSYGKELYVYAPNTTDITIHSGNTARLLLSGEWKLVDMKPFSLGMNVNGVAIAPTGVDTYDSKFGFGGGAGFFIQQELKNGKRLRGDLGYRYLDKDTDKFNQTEQEVRFAVGMDWTFGRD